MKNKSLILLFAVVFSSLIQNLEARNVKNGNGESSCSSKKCCSKNSKCCKKNKNHEEKNKNHEEGRDSKKRNCGSCKNKN